MTSIIKGAWNAASTATRLATGEPLQQDGSSSKLETFLTTLVTYPFLHLAATSGSSGSQRKGPIGAAADMLVNAKQGKTSGATEAGAGLQDYPEGKALMTLEKWCYEPVLASRLDDLLFKTREWLLAAITWQQEDMRVSASIHAKTQALENNSNAAQAKAYLQKYPQSQQLLVKALQVLSKGLDLYLGSTPPTSSLDMVVLQQLSHMANTPAGSNGQPTSHAVGTKQQDEEATTLAAASNPIERVALASSPNVHFITHELQRKHMLSRNKTLVEWLNVLLGFVRMWLNGVALLFYLFATGLRIVGNGLSALGGLFAFTVVLSIAISVLSALTFLAASASDATGSFLEFMARFTDLAKRRTATRRVGPPQLQDKMGPQSLAPMSFEELEDFFSLQLSTMPPGMRGGMGPGVVQQMGAAGLRSRPDVPRLANDHLLVSCYDAGLVDGNGALQPMLSADEVASLWDPSGFFGQAGPLTAKAGAVLLLRLLAWKHIAAIMSPPAMLGTSAGDVERALRYVFVAGVRGAGVATMYKALTGMPLGYQVRNTSQAAELKPILRHRSSFAVLCRDEEGDVGAHWITHPSHGIVSCLVFVVPANNLPGSLGLSEAGYTLQQQASNGAAPAGGSPSQLDVVWQVLALRRPVLVAINQASKISGKLQSGGDGVVVQLRSYLREEAARRGLEAEYISVMLTELLEMPPAGAVGVPQVQDWLTQSLAQSPQLR